MKHTGISNWQWNINSWNDCFLALFPFSTIIKTKDSEFCTSSWWKIIGGGPVQPQLLQVSGFCVENGWNAEGDNSTVHRDESQHGQHLISVYTNNTVQMSELQSGAWKPRDTLTITAFLFRSFSTSFHKRQVTSKHVTSLTRQQRHDDLVAASM